MLRRHFVLIGLLVVALALTCGAATAAADAISVNIAGSGAGSSPLGPTDTAGVVQVANWNNLTSVGTVSSVTVPNLLNDSGVNSGASITTNNFFNVDFGGLGAGIFNFGGYTLNASDAAMLNFDGFIRSATPVNAITMSSIPYTSYNVFVYSNENPGLAAQYTIGAQSYTLTNATPYSPVPPYSLGGNYVEFTHLSGSSFTLSVNGFFDADTDPNAQAAIAGIQIVAIPAPEPGTLVMLALSAVGIALVGRRGRIGKANG